MAVCAAGIWVKFTPSSLTRLSEIEKEFASLCWFNLNKESVLWGTVYMAFLHLSPLKPVGYNKTLSSAVVNEQAFKQAKCENL